jgi:hypothetical protein
VLPSVARSADGKAAGLDLPMMSLPEGDFVIQLTATDNGTSEHRLLAFRVLR